VSESYWCCVTIATTNKHKSDLKVEVDVDM
jgi:hypothetical protein